ncbi:RNA polymerase recycling motor HelD [Listeria sp. ILCC797]|uniref:RNA polymerase recycling motor HelD n=1 Tax=Listeria sp. ILCC797 TaxID=1918333 RepID=UPI000B593D8C|nr:RNA polymerase recycling motor HelD [Listeria sp. ILCC797]
MNKEEQNEQSRIDYTIQEIEKEQKRIQESLKSVKQEARDIRSNFWEDVRVNLAEPDDVSETNISIRQQEHFLRERERNYEHGEKQLTVFDKMKSSPYFARIDICDEETPREKIYIGIGSALDESDQFLVYDWRAPISSVYYDGQIGKSTYETPEGKLTVDVLLKRQFKIKNGRLESMFDTNDAIGDEMLQDVLGSESSLQMKNIVATIQQEQNRIIRDTKSDLLFVQGAAGSGKTSAVLQRIAYLLYRFRNGLDEKQMMIFSPNRLFNHYIANVLPELGEKNMIQTTFQDFTAKRLGKLDVESLFEQFENETNDARKEMMLLKESTFLMTLIGKYVSLLQNGGLRFKDIKFRGETVLSKEDIKAIFYATPRYKMPARLLETKKILREKLYTIANEEAKKAWVKDEMELLSEEQYRALVPTKLEFQSFDDEQDYLAKKIVRLKFKKLHQAVEKNQFLHVKQQFGHFMQYAPRLFDLQEFRLSEADWNAEIHRVVASLNENKLALEDAVLFLELNDAIVGKKINRIMRFVFIDEIQDYSKAQIAYLKSIFPSSQFTLLGDLNQAIFKKDEQSLLKEIAPLFDAERTSVVELTKSYRSTEQITNFTKEIMAESDRIIPFSRQGNVPKVIETENFVAMMEVLQEEALKLKETSNMVAIIGRNQEICEAAYLSLYKKMDVKLVHLGNQKLSEGIMIIPSYLAKGLEFDSVIVLDASEKSYPTSADKTLLYTICSRAMHDLIAVSDGEMTPLFKVIPSGLYEFEKRLSKSQMPSDS